MYEQAKALWSLATECFPRDLMSAIDKNSVGIGCVMTFLGAAESAVSAGAISRHMNVSTARVAVLLKNLEEKGLILRKKSGKDSRITLVELTEAGIAYNKQREESVYSFIDTIIARVGYDRLREFLLAGAEINQAVCELLKSEEKVITLQSPAGAPED